jgi:serine/threonine-protein kinase RsbT
MICPFDPPASFQKTKSGIPMTPEISVPILSDGDIVVARQKGCKLAVALGFSRSEAVLIATVISELARNIILYAGHGGIYLSRAEAINKSGIEIIAEDSGPGIPDIDKAIQEGHSTSGSLGKGLPGVKRLMDEFQIISRPGGTTVKIRKWKQ